MGRKKRLRKRIKGLEKQRDLHLDKREETNDEYLKEKYYPKEIKKFEEKIEEAENLLSRKKRKKSRAPNTDIVVICW